MRALTLTILALGCGGETAVELPTSPTVPVSICADGSYDWLPFDQVGSILEIEVADELSLDAPLIDFALERAGLDAFTPVPYGVRAWRVRYLTQDRGRIVEATTVLAVPDSPTAIEVPSVMWAHGTTGFTDACAPSAGSLEDNAAPILLASQGFAVTAPDYIGMNGFGEPAESLHPYLVVEPAVTGTLDSVRALWDLEAALDQPLAAKPTRKLALWGASEGGFHVLWADRYMDHYLPEAELVATVAAVPPSDLLGLAEEATKEGPVLDAAAGLIGGVVGQASWHGDMGLVGRVVPSPLAEEVVEAMQTTCSLGALDDGIETLEDAFKPEVLAAGRSGDWPEPFDCYLTEGTLHRSAVPREHDTPVLFQVSGADELVVGSVIAEDAGRLCDAGYHLDYLECEGADHVEGAAQSLPLQLQWLKDRLAGVPLEVRCDLDDVRDCSEIFDF